MELSFTAWEQENDIFLRNFLRSRGVSQSLMRSIKTHGGFYCGKEPIRTNERVKTGQEISFSLPPPNLHERLAQDIPAQIAFEDVHAMVLNKCAGLTVHPTLGYKDGTLANAFYNIMHKRQECEPFRPINRIDRNTSGLVLCALNEYAAPLLAQNVKKEYFAIVQGYTQNCGEINLPIGAKEGSYIERCVTDSGKNSVTSYTTLWQGNGLSLVKAVPITGRTHQIRVHFSHIGHPLAGDDLYGGSLGLINRHALHCGKIIFDDIEKVYGARVVSQCTCGNKTDGANGLTRQITTKIEVSAKFPQDMASLLPQNIIDDCLLSLD